VAVNLVSHLLIDCFRSRDKGNGRRLFSELLRETALAAADASENERNRPVLCSLHRSRCSGTGLGNAIQLSSKLDQPSWHLAGLLTYASANLNSLPEKFSVAGAWLHV
jgi:hypothetical protein